MEAARGWVWIFSGIAQYRTCTRQIIISSHGTIVFLPDPHVQPFLTFSIIMTEMKWIVSYCFCSKSSLICLPRGTNFFLGSLVKCTLWMWYVLSTKKMKYNLASTDPFSRDLCTVWNLCKASEEFFNTQEDIVDILLWKHIFCSYPHHCFFLMFWTLVLHQNWKLPLYNHS